MNTVEHFRSNYGINCSPWVDFLKVFNLVLILSDVINELEKNNGYGEWSGRHCSNPGNEKYKHHKIQ